MEKKEMIQGLIRLKSMMLTRGINETWANDLITEVIKHISNDDTVIQRAVEWLKKEWYSPYDLPEAREFIDSKINEFVISLEE